MFGLILILNIAYHLVLIVDSTCPERNDTEMISIYTAVNGMQSTLREAFERDGFITDIKIFDQNSNEMENYKQRLNELESQVENGKFVGQEINPHLSYKFLWDIATHPKILSVLNEIFSDNLALLATTLFTKYPLESNESDAKYVGFHQDVMYWGLEPAKALNIWFAFDDVTENNGPMLYIPKTHTNGHYEHQILNKSNNILIGTQEIPNNLFDINSAVPLILNVGSIGIHSGYLIHGSRPNLSSQRRCGFVIRYIDLETKVIDQGTHLHRYANKADIPEWRTPRIICGTAKKNIEQFYPHPEFIENPEIPKPTSFKCRHFEAQTVNLFERL